MTIVEITGGIMRAARTLTGIRALPAGACRPPYRHCGDWPICGCRGPYYQGSEIPGFSDFSGSLPPEHIEKNKEILAGRAISLFLKGRLEFGSIRWGTKGVSGGGGAND